MGQVKFTFMQISTNHEESFSEKRSRSESALPRWKFNHFDHTVTTKIKSTTLQKNHIIH